MALATDLEAAAAAADDLPTAADALDDRDEIPVREIFSEAFVREYTDFATFDEMVEASPSDASSADELGAIPGGAWDEFVAETTVFADERELVLAARDSWVADRLGL